MRYSLTSHHRPLTSLKQRKTLEQGVAAVEDADLEDEQQEGEDAEGLELFVEIAVDRRGSLLLGQFVEFIVELLLGGTVVLHMDIDAPTGSSQLLTHLLVEG